MKFKISYLTTGVFCLIVAVLSYYTLVNYPGRVVIYIIFTIVINSLFVIGFTKNRIFFDTFIGIFLWLGFWLKLSVRIAFLNGEFQEPIGMFNKTGVEYDHALLVTCCGVVALLFASFIRRRFLFSYKIIADKGRFRAVFDFYRNHRKIILALFVFLFLTIAITNSTLGIYQRGSVPRTALPMGLSGIYTWLLLFGMASFSAVILDCEFRLKNNPYFVSILTLLECFFSNVSMLSRGLILNGGSLYIGISENAKKRYINPSLQYRIIIMIILGILFISSVVAVNHIRSYLFFSVSPNLLKSSTSSMLEPIARSGRNIQTLLIDRWVGIEGVMAVVSYPNLGWSFWKKAWQEKYQHFGTSMYDRKILEYKYSDIHLSQHHFINLPGILAFFYYPGSFIFLFISMFFLGLLASAIEWSVYKLSGANIILCSLIGQVVAYRYTHFGYVPSQSYLLFGSIFLNVIMIYLLNKYLNFRKKQFK